MVENERKGYRAMKRTMPIACSSYDSEEEKGKKTQNTKKTICYNDSQSDIDLVRH